MKSVYSKIAFFIVLATVAKMHGQTTSAGLALFQQFVNGQVPVKEAVVYREISNNNGKVLNKEWWQFAYQNDSWFVQRLIPDATNSAKLIPRDSTIYGASFKQLWMISDQNLAAVGKDVATGSLPAKNLFYRTLIFSALSLGIPRQSDALSITDAPVKWNSLEFNSVIVSQRDKMGTAMATAPLQGQLIQGNNGCPVSAVYPEIGQYPGGEVTYEYEPSDATGIPKSFVEQYGNEKCRYEFLSLKLGEDNFMATNGYVPSLFADMTLKRIVTQYTNGLAYEQRDGKSYPSFQSPTPKLGQPAPPLRGAIWFNSTESLALDSLHGKVVLLDFWSIYCPPCIEDFPHIEGLYNRFKGQGLVVIGVSGGWGIEKHLDPFLKEHNVTFPILVDEDLAIADNHIGYTAWSYSLDANPSYVLVDKSGNLAWKSTLGKLPTESQIKQLLEDSPTK
jgi:peroxiredoxin